MRYQYSSVGFRRKWGNSPMSIPSGVKMLLILNIVVFIITELSDQKNLFYYTIGLVPSLIFHEYKIWQTFTYLFVHGDFFHIFFNMFVLWMFGKDLEADWGKNEFLLYYFVCGSGAGLFTAVISMNSYVPVVGASGAIYGVLAAYGLSYPNRIVLLYGMFPLKTKFMVWGIGIIAFFASISSSQSGISHITHLSGMIIGLLYFSFNINWKTLYLWYLKLRTKSIQNRSHTDNEKDIILKVQVDKILDKLNDEGWESLTNKEEELLTKASRKYFDDHAPN